MSLRSFPKEVRRALAKMPTRERNLAVRRAGDAALEGLSPSERAEIEADLERLSMTIRRFGEYSAMELMVALGAYEHRKGERDGR